MRPAANITLLWPELPYLERFDAASAAGFKAVEILFPYETAAKETQGALGRAGLDLILINAPPPNYTGGEPGYSAIAGGAARFRKDMTRAFRYAQALGVGMIHVMTGKAEGEEAHRAVVENMTWAAAHAPKGVTLTLEPLNQIAQPGYFLSDYALAADIIREVGADNLTLQFDSYHSQMIHGDAVAVFEQYADVIGHVQIGDTPDRTPPGTGTVDFEALFAAIRASGYDGWISGEYFPGKATEETLGWLEMI